MSETINEQAHAKAQERSGRVEGSQTSLIGSAPRSVNDRSEVVGYDNPSSRSNDDGGAEVTSVGTAESDPVGEAQGFGEPSGSGNDNGPTEIASRLPGQDLQY